MGLRKEDYLVETTAREIIYFNRLNIVSVGDEMRIEELMNMKDR